MKREVIAYLFFGVCTTAVNYIAYFLLKQNMPYQAANAIAWVIAVIFAYITNKIWVFESKTMDPKLLLKEIGAFFSGRIVSGIFDMVFLIAAVEWMGMGEELSKIVSNVVVVIINYVISKLFVFKN